MGGSGLMATSRDLMLFALLILNNGKLNGKQYISADYIKESTSFQTATCVTGPVPSESQGYGLQFWIGEHNSIVCYGMGGQLAILLPEYNTAIVTTADTQGYQGGNQVIYDAIFCHILPELEKRQSPWTPSDEEKLAFEQFMSKLAMRPLNHNKAASEAWNNKFENVNDINTSFLTNFRPIMSSFEWTYVIKKASDAAEALDKNIINETIWDEISFEMSEPLTPSCTGKVSLKCHVFPSIVDSTVDSPVTFEFGFGALKEGTLNMTTHMGNRADEPVPVSMHYAASAEWLSENMLYIRVHLLDTSVGSIHIQAVFGESDITVFLRKQEETLFGEFSGHLYGTRQ
jgi:hypothetical protein